MEVYQDLIKSSDILKNILSKSRLDSFKYLKFNYNSDINKVYNFFRYGIPIEIPDNLDESEISSLIIDKITEEFFNDKINENYRNILLSFTTQLSNSFKNASNIIKNTITPKCEELYTEIKNLTNTYLKQKNLGNLLEDTLDITTDHLSIFEWDGIKSTSSIRDICNLVNDIYNLNITKLDDFFTKNIFTIVRTRVLKDKSNLDALKNINQLDELKDENLVNIFKAILAQLNKPDNINYTIVKIVKQLYSYENLFNQLIKKYQDHESDLSKALNIVNILQFLCIFYKKTLFSSTLILNENTVNQEIYEKFQQQGKSLEDIAKYLRVYYLNKPLPIRGISINEVLSSNYNEELDIINNAILLKKKSYLREIIAQAYTNTLIDKFEDLCEYFNMEYNKNDEISYKDSVVYKSKHIHGSLARAEKELYHLIIETFYKNTLIEYLYNILYTKIKDLIDLDTSEDNSITYDNDVKKTILDAYITILMDFLYKYFLKELP